MKTSIDSNSLVNTQYEDNASLLNSGSNTPISVVNESHRSPMPNIKYGPNIIYGVGMLAFMAIPPLIPGVTTRTIIIGFMSLIVSIYTVAGILAVIRARHPARQRKMA